MKKRGTSFKSRKILGEYETPQTVLWLVDKGLFKTERGAGYFLIFIMMFCFASSITLIWAFIYFIQNL